jgi:hypothetical protein
MSHHCVRKVASNTSLKAIRNSTNVYYRYIECLSALHNDLITYRRNACTGWDCLCSSRAPAACVTQVKTRMVVATGFDVRCFMMSACTVLFMTIVGRIGNH